MMITFSNMLRPWLKPSYVNSNMYSKVLAACE